MIIFGDADPVILYMRSLYLNKMYLFLFSFIYSYFFSHPPLKK